MTFPVNGSIPQPGDDPSLSQVAILTNFSNIVGWSSVDHLPYGAANAGEHAKVTIPSINVPSLPAAPTLFTNNGVSVPQLFFYSGNAAQSSSQYVAAQNGSTFLFGGIIIKWGLATTATANPVAFASPFPNNCFSVVAQANDTSSPTNANSYVYIYNQTVSGFNATGVQRTAKAAASLNYFYIAIGN